MSPAKILTIALRLTMLIVTVFALVFAMASGLIPDFLNIPNIYRLSLMVCHVNDAPLIASSAWHITATDSAATILWQKKQDRERTIDVLFDPNSGFTASNQQLIYLWEPTFSNPLLDPRKLVALDAKSGTAQWCSIPRGPFHRVVAIANGYAVLSDVTLTKLDYDGTVAWSNDQFPSRETKSLDESTTALYIPSHVYPYQVSAQTGDMISTPRLDHAVNIWDDYAVVANGSDKLNILDRANNQTIASIPLFDTFPLEDFAKNLWPFTARYGDVFLIYYRYQRDHAVEAYQISTGKLLWTIKQPYLGYPTVFQGNLVLYVPSGLKIYSLQTGQQTSYIDMSRTVNGVTDNARLTDVWLTANQNSIFINIRDTWEILAIGMGK